MLFGGKLGSGPDVNSEDEETSLTATKTVKPGQRVSQRLVLTESRMLNALAILYRR